MAQYINHCGHNIPVEARYAVSHYPAKGDFTYFERANCRTCQKPVHSYFHVYLKGRRSGTSLSDKHNRGRFEAFIRQGEAWLCEPPGRKKDGENSLNKETRAMVMVCEYTLKTARPADTTLHYLERIASAPSVLEHAEGFIRASDVLQRKRQAWLNSLQSKSPLATT